MAKQQEIPGTEVPTVPIVDEALDALFSAKRDQKEAASTVKLRTDALHMHMVEAGIDRHPYIDEKTGKKKLYYLDRTPRGKSINAPKGAKPKADKPGEAQDSDELAAKRAKKKADKEAAEVEHKKRSRSSVAAELAERDAEIAKRDAEADPIGNAAADATAASEDSWQPGANNPYAEDDAPSDAGALVGKRVKFNHQQELPETHLVTAASDDGLVSLEGWEGWFAPTVLTVVEVKPPVDDEDPRPAWLREKTEARSGSLLEEAEQHQAAVRGDLIGPETSAIGRAAREAEANASEIHGHKERAPKVDPIDRETRASGKCGLIHRDSGSICVTAIGGDGKHAGLHTNASGWKWKARMPKEAM